MTLFRLLSNHFTTTSKLFIGIAFSLAAPAQAQVFDSYSLEAGKSNNANMYKLGAQKMFAQNNAFLNQYYLRPYVEFSVAQFNLRQYQNTPGHKHSLINVGITPILRWQKNVNQGFFGEIGIGVNYMSDHYNNAGRTASTKFQFGDHIGIGYKWSNSLEIAVRYRHYSNGSIKQPNPAINFMNVQLAYSF